MLLQQFVPVHGLLVSVTSSLLLPLFDVMIVFVFDI